MANLINHVSMRFAPGYADKIKSEMLENAHQSVKEDGCLQFDVVQSCEDENVFIYYEVYTGAAALDAHRQTPHFKAYWELMESMGDKVEREAKLFTQIS